MGTSITEITYEKLEDFFSSIIDINGKLFREFIKCSSNEINIQYIFRGESSIKNELIPSALRPDNEAKLCMLSGQISPNRGIRSELEQIQCEDRILKKFFYRCDYNGLKVPSIEKLRYHNLPSGNYYENFHWLPEDYFELAGLAQHYGLPTRLLDWSANFFIALYFALRNAKIENEYCSIWAFNYVEISGYFVDRSDKLKVIIPEYSQNPNLQAQKGVFTHWQTRLFNSHIKDAPVDRRPLNELFEDQIRKNESKEFSNLFYKINIPIKFSKELYIYLSTIGFDGSTLFPGYDGVTRSIEEDSKFLQ